MLTLLSIVVIGGMLVIAYLYVFNRRTRQSLHDLCVQSYVVRASAEPSMDLLGCPTRRSPRRPRCWSVGSIRSPARCAWS
jgi:hypothetical protein